MIASAFSLFRLLRLQRPSRFEEIFANASGIVDQIRPVRPVVIPVDFGPQLSIPESEGTLLLLCFQPGSHRVEGFESRLLPEDAAAAEVIVQMTLEFPVIHHKMGVIEAGRL